MNNHKFIIYNYTKTFVDNEIFAYISDVMSKGLISGNNEFYCYASTYKYENKILCIELKKQNYGYKIIAYEELLKEDK